MVLRRDADPRVADGDFHRTISLPGLNSDPSSLWSELHALESRLRRICLILRSSPMKSL